MRFKLLFIFIGSFFSCFSQNNWEKIDKEKIASEVIEYLIDKKDYSQDSSEMIALCFTQTITKEYSKEQYNQLIDVEIKNIRNDIIKRCLGQRSEKSDLKTNNISNESETEINHTINDNSDWQILDDTDGKIFPSTIISLVNSKDKWKDIMSSDNDIIGNQLNSVYFKIKTNEANSTVKIEIKGTNLFDSNIIEYKLPLSNHEYYIYPDILWYFDKLTNLNQPIPVNFTFNVSLNNIDLKQKSKIITVRSVSECLTGIYDSENNEFTDLFFLFSAYVNENNPLIDEILREALNLGIVESFDGYYSEAKENAVLNQVFAIWYALQKRGFKYSSITATSQSSNKVYSQRVRPFEVSLNTSQANCVDGTVLFASILRAIKIEPILIGIPGHMFLGYYKDSKKENYTFLETTLMGMVNLDEQENERKASADSFNRATSYARQKFNSLVDKFNDKSLTNEYHFLAISKELRLYIQPVGR